MDNLNIAQSIVGVNLVLADGVYPYPDPIDRFVVIIGGEEVAWCETQAQAQRSYIELIHYDAAHRQKCPDDYIPFDGIAVIGPLYECRHCGVQVHLTPADMYGEDLAVCECGRFFTPVIEADDYGLSAVA